MFTIGDTVVYAGKPDTAPERFLYAMHPNDPSGRCLRAFTFICTMTPQSGHCVLCDISNGKILTMEDMAALRLATEEEC